MAPHVIEWTACVASTPDDAGGSLSEAGSQGGQSAEVPQSRALARDAGPCHRAGMARLAL